MKKTIFLFATLLTIVLVGCSQVDDNEIQTNKPENGKLYKMSFNMSEFQIESTPLKNQTKAESNLKGDFLQYIIYKEDGSPLQAKTFTKEELIKMSDETNSDISFEVELPIGKYTIAALTGPFYSKGYPMPYSPENFATDYSSGNLWIAQDSGNGGIFYESSSFEISEDIDNNTISMTLKPMWSTMTIKVTNANTCDFPTNTAIISYSISPYADGFYLKTKEPKYFPHSSGFNRLGGGEISVMSFKSGTDLYFITDKTKDAIIKIQFYSENTNASLGKLLGEQTIYTGDIERGKNIVLKGKLAETSTKPGTNTPSFKLSYVEMEDVEIPFTE